MSYVLITAREPKLPDGWTLERRVVQENETGCWYGAVVTKGEAVLVFDDASYELEADWVEEITAELDRRLAKHKDYKPDMLT